MAPESDETGWKAAESKIWNKIHMLSNTKKHRRTNAKGQTLFPTLTIRQVFSADENAVQVALSPAVCDVSPVLLLINLPQAGKPIEHAHLKLTGVHAL